MTQTLYAHINKIKIKKKITPKCEKKPHNEKILANHVFDLYQRTYIQT
jgi:hypothetical protein